MQHGAHAVHPMLSDTVQCWGARGAAAGCRGVLALALDGPGVGSQGAVSSCWGGWD